MRTCFGLTCNECSMNTDVWHKYLTFLKAGVFEDNCKKIKTHLTRFGLIKYYLYEILRRVSRLAGNGDWWRLMISV